MHELNPNHPVTAGIHDHWHKLVAILLVKFDLGRVVITSDDLAKMKEGTSVVAHDKRDGLHLYLVDEAEAARLAREQGGLPT